MTEPVNNDLESSQPDAKSIDGGEPAVRFAKARRYLGLLIALGFMVIMFQPVKNYPSGLSNFMARTMLTQLVVRTERGYFAKDMRAYEARCEAAQRSVDAQTDPNKKALSIQNARNQCDPEPMLGWNVDTLVRLARLDPDFLDQSQEYRALKKTALADQGLEFNQSPKMTPEMRDLAPKLLKPLIAEALAAEQWIARMILAMHALVLVVGIWGVVYRQALGSIAIAPLGWIFGLGVSGAKAAHEIHKKI